MIIVIDDIIGIWHIYIYIHHVIDCILDCGILWSMTLMITWWDMWDYIYIPMGLYNVIFPKISLIVWNEIPYQWDYIRNVNRQPASKLDKRQDSDELVNG